MPCRVDIGQQYHWQPNTLSQKHRRRPTHSPMTISQIQMETRDWSTDPRGRNPVRNTSILRPPTPTLMLHKNRPCLSVPSDLASVCEAKVGQSPATNIYLPTQPHLNFRQLRKHLRPPRNPWVRTMSISRAIPSFGAEDDSRMLVIDRSTLRLESSSCSQPFYSLSFREYTWWFRCSIS